MSNPFWYESAIDKQIREATERGDFDDLPGTGKPLTGLGDPDDELWWLKGYLRREGLSTDPLLPTPLRLRKQIEELTDTVAALSTEDQVRQAVRALNRRIADWLRSPDGPPIPVRMVDVDRMVGRWRAARAAAQPRNTEPPTPAPRAHRWWRRRRGAA